MPRRLAAFVVLAAALAVVFIRLGIWQLDRRAERLALNDAIARQLARPAVPLSDILADPAVGNRRASVHGAPDYEHEIVVTGRTRSGSPGVHILTPLRIPESDTALLVNRGWVYSPDARTVDLTRWREERTHFSGFTQLLPPDGSGEARAGERSLRRISHSAVAGLLPYPVHRVYLVAQDTALGVATPARLETPLPGSGPHLSYAIQWFSFAAIAVIGAVAVVRRARRSNGAQIAT